MSLPLVHSEDAPGANSCLRVGVEWKMERDSQTVGIYGDQPCAMTGQATTWALCLVPLPCMQSSSLLMCMASSKDEVGVWTPATHVGEPDKLVSPGFSLAEFGPCCQVRVNQQMKDHSLSLLSL